MAGDFQLLSVEEAENILRDLPKTAETFGLRVRAGRRLMPVTTAEERERAKTEKANPRPSVGKNRAEESRAATTSRNSRPRGTAKGGQTGETVSSTSTPAKKPQADLFAGPST